METDQKQIYPTAHVRTWGIISECEWRSHEEPVNTKRLCYFTQLFGGILTPESSNLGSAHT